MAGTTEIMIDGMATETIAGEIVTIATIEIGTGIETAVIETSIEEKIMEIILHKWAVSIITI